MLKHHYRKMPGYDQSFLELIFPHEKKTKIKFNDYNYVILLAHLKNL